MISLSRIPQTIVGTPPKNSAASVIGFSQRQKARFSDITLAEMIADPIMIALLKSDGLNVASFLEAVRIGQEALSRRSQRPWTD